MRKPEYLVKVLDGPRTCDASTGPGQDMIMYRFVCSQSHMPPIKVTVLLTRLQDQQQPDVVNVVAEQLKSIVAHGGRLSNCYGYRNGLLRPSSK
jgi:hypothetical protein